MSQYQPNAAPSRSLIEKINSKFSGLSVSSSTNHTEKDGNSEDDTLIHKAFVKYFEERGEAYPEWLGVKESKRSSRNGVIPPARNSQTEYFSNSNSQFQPVRASYNSNTQNNESNVSSAAHSRQSSVTDAEGEDRPYTRRANSQLRALYNKSRQQSVTGSGYPGSSQQTQQVQNPPTSRSNSSGQRLRDRVMQSSSYNGDAAPRATWGKQ